MEITLTTVETLESFVNRNLHKWLKVNWNFQHLAFTVDQTKDDIIISGRGILNRQKQTGDDFNRI